jgi:hypothetical protein
MNMAKRYLSQIEIKHWLENGRPVEQWLSAQPDGNDRVIKWVRIHKERRGGYGTTFFEIYDQGNESFIDVYEFQSYDPDEPYGLMKIFDDWESALSYATTELGANPERFVSDGVIQNEYKDFIILEGVLPANRVG